MNDCPRQNPAYRLTPFFLIDVVCHSSFVVGLWSLVKVRFYGYRLPVVGRLVSILAIFGQKVANFWKVHVKTASGNFSQYFKLKVNY